MGGYAPEYVLIPFLCYGFMGTGKVVFQMIITLSGTNNCEVHLLKTRHILE